MLHTFVVTTAKLCAILPAIFASVWALFQASQATEFPKRYPSTQQKLSQLLDNLIYIVVEHWLGYIIICSGAGFLWTLVVAEPKKAAKVRYDNRRRTGPRP